MKNILNKIGKKIIILPAFILLTGCEDYSFTKSINNLETVTKQTIRDISDYNYSEFWNNITTSYDITKRKHFPEIQKIKLETPRNTQVSAYTSIINICKNIDDCEITDGDLEKTLLFPDNITGKLSIELPIDEAQELINQLTQYGNVVENEFKKNNFIKKDLEYFYAELLPLRETLLKTNEQIENYQTYKYEKINEMQEYAKELNKKILFLENDIEYLNEIDDIRQINIKIARGHNSTISLVKAKIQNGFFFLINQIHIITIILLIYFAIYLSKVGKVLLIRFKNWFIKEIKSINLEIKRKKIEKPSKDLEFKPPTMD